jgi:hypothetical protein
MRVLDDRPTEPLEVVRVATRGASIDPFGRQASELSIFGESFHILDHALLMVFLSSFGHVRAS